MRSELETLYIDNIFDAVVTSLTQVIIEISEQSLIYQSPFQSEQAICRYNDLLYKFLSLFNTTKCNIKDFLQNQTCLQTIYNRVCLEGRFEIDSSKKYYNTIIICEDFEKYQTSSLLRKHVFNFLLDLNLIEEILNTGEIKPVTCQVIYAANGCNSKNFSIFRSIDISHEIIHPTKLTFSIADVSSYLHKATSNVRGFFGARNSVTEQVHLTDIDLSKEYCDDKIPKDLFSLVMDTYANANLIKTTPANTKSMSI